MKGKKAAQAANRRAASASATIDELRAELAQEKEAHAAEVAELKAQIQKAQGRLTSEVETLAEVRVFEAQQVARQRIEQFRQQQTEAGYEVIKLLHKSSTTIRESQWPVLCELLGVEFGEAMVRTGRARNRQDRRASTKSMRGTLERKRQIESAS